MNGRVFLFTLSLAIVPLLAGAASRPTSKCSQPPSGLVSWWPGDTNENDLLGGNNPIGVSGISLVPGEVSNGFTFGSNGYVEIPAASNLANQKFTWAAWVNPTDAYADQYGSVIVVQNSDTQSDVVALDWRKTPDARFLFVFGNQVNETIYSAHTFPPGAFYHVAGTYDGKTFRLYVNGVLEGSFKESKPIAYTSDPWGIGQSFISGVGSGFREWIGAIDEVQAFNRALSAAELLSIFKAGSLGECKGLVLDPTTLTFAKQPVGTKSTAQGVVVMNVSSSTVTLNSIGFSGTNASDFSLEANTCGGFIGSTIRCLMTVAFTPSAAGRRTATMLIKDNAVGSPQKVKLKGTGE